MWEAGISCLLAKIVNVVGNEGEYVIIVPLSQSIDIRFNDDRVSDAVDLAVERRSLRYGAVCRARLDAVTNRHGFSRGEQLLYQPYGLIHRLATCSDLMVNFVQLSNDVVATVFMHKLHDLVLHSLEMARQASPAGTHYPITITCELAEDYLRDNELDFIRLCHGKHRVKQRQVARILGQVEPNTGLDK